jgi:hypothetical protein
MENQGPVGVEPSTPQEEVSFTLEMGAEELHLKAPAGKSVKAVVEDHHLVGALVLVNGVRIGGKPGDVPPDTPVKSGDAIASVPTSGKLGD